MKTLLQIRSSIFSDHGQSSQIANRFVANWRRANPDGTLVVRDLAKDPVPHLTAERFQAFLAKPETRTPQQQALVHESDRLIDELKAADTVVIGLPMYNFALPSTLKAYFDHIARAGVTFKYTDKGPVGLLTGKKTYVVVARGGQYGPEHSHAEYVRGFLAFLGLTDVEFVYAEGLNISAEAKEQSLGKAHADVDRIAPPALLAA